MNRAIMPADAAQKTLRPVREVIPQLSRKILSLCNNIYYGPAYALPQGRSLIWQAHRDIVITAELSCKVGATPLILAAQNLGKLEPRLYGFESFVPSEACTALVEHALSPVLDLLEILSGCSVMCGDFKPSATGHHSTLAQAQMNTPNEEALRIGFTVLMPSDSVQSEQVRGWVSAPTHFWNGLDFSAAQAVRSKRHQALPIDFCVELGKCRLKLTEIQQLTPGDALRISPKLPRQTLNHALPVRLVNKKANLGCKAQVSGDQLTLETPISAMMTTSPPPSSNNTTNPSASSSAHTDRLSSPEFLNTIECELSFELGNLRMTLAEVSKLRAGHAIRMGSFLQEQPVRILSNGRQIARGELAAVGDELVVVLTETNGLPDV
jgi:type III secretion system YscQ/HrcQ family protein